MQCNQTKATRRAFTLVELMVVIAIIALLAAMSLSALATATEQAKVQRTRAIINKIDQLVMEKWEGYRTRAVPIAIPNGTSPRAAAQIRLHAIRDLMRMELPDRKSDVTDDPADVDPVAMSYAKLAAPAAWRGYRRRAIAMQTARGQDWLDDTAGWTTTSQGSECLYLILAGMRDGDKSALEYFSAAEIGDLDEDGMPEILDGWGRPIEFLRWAPGYVKDPDTSTFTNDYTALTDQSRDATTQHDPFDPLRLEANAFALVPLIFSGGTDKEFDVFTDNLSGFHHYSPPAGTPDNNYPRPYTKFTEGKWAGEIYDRDSDGEHSYMDNITNHFRGDQ
jgi:prepilin-type N-terminal cleavage/methylation domain-containing protein